MFVKKMMKNKSEDKQLMVSWCLYDWANSCFSAIIITFVFSAYFTQKIAPSPLLGTAYWSMAITISGLIIAVLAPLFGCWLSQTENKRAALKWLTCCSVVAVSLLFFSKPNVNWLWYALIFVVIAEIFYELALVVYNSLLLLIASEDNFGRVSGWGWGAGYIGGLVVLSLCLMIVKEGWVTDVESLNIRVSTLICAAWFLLFSLPLFYMLPSRIAIKNKVDTSLRGHFLNLKKTFMAILCRKKLFWLMLTRLFVMDGLNTLFSFGGIYAAGTFGFSMTQVLLFAILLNVTAGVGAFVMGWLDDLLSPLFVIIVSLVFLIVLVTTAMVIHSPVLFWVTGGVIGFFVGPAQSATRSFLAHLIGNEDPSQFFGFYSFSGRISSFLGPMCFGLLVTWFHTQRAGIAVISLLLLIGLICAIRISQVKEVA